MDRETLRIRYRVYRDALLHGLADAMIVFFPCAVIVGAAHVLLPRAVYDAPWASLALRAMMIVIVLGAAIRAARAAARARITAHRRAMGQCLNCGYDLRASVEHCPECGRPIRTARYG